MKKIKLFALALLATFSLSAMADETLFLWQHDGSSTYGGSNGVHDMTGATTGIIKFVTYESKTSGNDGTIGYNDAVTDDDLKPNITKGLKLGNNGAHLRISPAEGNFQAGDIIYICGYNPVILSTSDDPTSTAKISTADGGATILSSSLTLGAAKGSCNVGEFTLPENFSNDQIYITRTGSSVAIAAIKVVRPAPACTEPTAGELSLSSNAPAALYEGTEVTISMAGGHGSGRSLTLDGETWMGYPTWSAVAGRHVIRVSEPQWEDTENNVVYCGGEDSVVLNVLAATPVTECTIAGPATGVIGAQLTYTATAANATTYEWYVDGVAANNNSATFNYTATIGNHVIKAFATNDFTAPPVESNEINVTVTKLCGELIKATHTGGKTATVEGVVGGTYDKNTANDSKFGGKGQYFGITLADGEKFQKTDILNVHTSTAAGQGTIAIYADKDGNTLLYDTESMGVAGDNEIVLPAALDGLSTLYICRTEGNTWNGYVDYISVSRSCEESDNANIDKVWVRTGETEEQYYEPESDGVTYNLVVPASVDIAELDVYFSLEHPLATADQNSPIHFIVPAAGAAAVSQGIEVTAENADTKNYIINVSKSAAASTEAHLSSLSVNGFTLDPVFDENTFAYTITKPFGAANPGTDAVVAEPADPTAHPHTEAVGANQLVVTVTAEDGVSQEVYTITINTAEAPKTLERVLFANGFDAFIDNAARTVKAYYMAGEAAPEAAQITAGSGTAGPMTGNTIGVTGADMSYVEYTVTLEEVTPYTDAVAADAAAGVFDGTEAWVKTGILESGNAAGFSGDYYVIRRQKKGSDPADDQRVFAGYVRAYFFVGNASELQLTIGSNKAVKYAVDGGEYTEDASGALAIALEEGNHMIEIVSNQQSGDGRISAPKLIERGSSTALDEAAGEVKARKIVRDGQIIIVRGDKEFNLVGAEL